MKMNSARILHISPTFFSPESVVGGGERFAFELAKTMALKEDVMFLSFSQHPKSYCKGPLKVRLIKRWCSIDFFKLVGWADIIHCHQIRYPQTDAAILLSRIMGKRVFVTDLGGGCSRVLSDHLPVRALADGYLLISEYSEELIKRWAGRNRPRFLRVIYGGVDTDKFKPGYSRRLKNKVLYVGRIVSHKGIEYLIEGLPEHVECEIVGTVYDQDYFEYLKEKSKGKKVSFVHNATDSIVVEKMREATVVVQPSIYEDYVGRTTRVTELLGLAALEAMACGTPVIVSDAGSLPEIVIEGGTGFIVPQKSSAAIKEKIEFLISHPDEAEQIGRAGRRHVLEKFNWPEVAEGCVQSYSARERKAVP